MSNAAKKDARMLTKSFGTKVKTTGVVEEVGQGEVVMLVSAFGNVDEYGDIVQKGAFTESLKQWEASGDRIPFIWAHDWSNPMAHVGYVAEATETDEGLLVKAVIDLDTAESRKVFNLLKGRRVTQASFGFTIDDCEMTDEARVLKAVSIIECGPCLVGANPETALISAKAHEMGEFVKSGHTLTEEQISTLRTAVTVLSDVVGGYETSTSEVDDATASPTEAAGTEVSASHSRTAQARARLILQTL